MNQLKANIMMIFTSCDEKVRWTVHIVQLLLIFLRVHIRHFILWHRNCSLTRDAKKKSIKIEAVAKCKRQDVKKYPFLLYVRVFFCRMIYLRCWCDVMYTPQGYYLLCSYIFFLPFFISFCFLSTFFSCFNINEKKCEWGAIR